MKRVILITGHYYESKRKAGFHGLADAYRAAGWEVIFMTIGISWLSYLRRDYRLQYPIKKESGHLKQIKDGLYSYVWFTPYHPVTFFWLNNLVRPFLKNYKNLPLGEIEELISGTDTFIFESSYGLALFDKFKSINPNAKYIYRVSDDLRILRVHPLIREAEENNAPKFDLISVPSGYLLRRFGHLSNAALHYHGIRKDLYDCVCANPYPPDTVNVVFVGNSHFDYDFLQRASSLCPTWQFHIIGPLKNLPHKPNLHTYGEMPFADTIPYVKFANIGLQTRSYGRSVESLTDSLKVIQYQYCRLPIIAPEFLQSSRKGVFYYSPCDDSSILGALTAAHEYDRTLIDTSQIHTWDELVGIFAQEK